MNETPMTFSLRVDGGEERQITVATGIYMYAAMAVPALLGIDLPARLYFPGGIPEAFN